MAKINLFDVTFDDVKAGDLITVQVRGFNPKSRKPTLINCNVKDVQPYDILNDEIDLYFLRGKWRYSPKIAKLPRIERKVKLVRIQRQDDV